jgi:AcrR family transcriptional regulator
MRKRAIYDDDKELRRGQILAAARALFLERDGRLATVTEVAARAGIAKGTVYLYFRTKEELYVTLYEEGMQAFLGRVRGVAESRVADARERIVETMCAFIAEQPELLRLASLLNGVLEHNVGAEFVHAYKSRIGVTLTSTAVAFTEALPGVGLDTVARLLLRSYAFAVGLWQQADLPEVVKGVLAGDPALAMFRIDFERELASGLALIWREEAAPRPSPKGRNR